jgi:hypothetical protein
MKVGKEPELRGPLEVLQEISASLIDEEVIGQDPK